MFYLYKEVKDEKNKILSKLSSGIKKRTVSRNEKWNKEFSGCWNSRWDRWRETRHIIRYVELNNQHAAQRGKDV